MRPVERGTAPRAYTKYEQAIGDLEARLGRYCSYCERKLPIGLAVEHAVAKSLDPALRTSWTNLLLGCLNCNSVKWNKPTDEDTFLWPDRDNTFRAFEYAEGGFVRVATGLAQDTEAPAHRLMALVGLDRHKAGGWPRPAKRDKRWLDREEVWALAVRLRGIARQLDSNEARDCVVAAAVGYGFFSVWMTVFADDRHVKIELVQRFPGTSTACFDAQGAAVMRPGGRV